MAFNTTKGECYFVELAPPFSRIEIQFVPDEISYPRNVNLHGVNVVGRNHDIFHYSGGQDDLKLNLDFYSDEEGNEDVMRKLQWLRSLGMSDGQNGGIRKVKLVMGDLFPYEVWLVRGFNPILSHLNDQSGWLPLRAKVEIRLVLAPDENLLINDVRR